MNEKTIVIIGTLGTILLGVIGSLIAWFAGKDTLQGNGKEIVREMFNLELSLTVVGLLICWIPVVNMLCGLLALTNLVFAILAFIAYKDNKEFKTPSFIKVV